MADKEASVFIVDLGASMGDCHNGRIESDLDWSMRYVWDKISTTVAASRKTWTIGVLGLRTDETRSALQEEEGYENISVLQDIGPMTMTSLKELQPSIKPSDTESGDAISAIVIAVDMISSFTKQLKYKRRVYLITDGTAPMDGDDLDDITKKINEDGIELIVLGVDFDDPEYGYKEEDKPSQKKQNETILRDLTSKCSNAQFATIAEAIDELDTPRIKPVRPFKCYEGPLTLGDPNDPKHPTPVVINVERYFKTKQARPVTASTVVVKSDPGSASQAQSAGDHMEGVEPSGNFSAVKHDRTYRVNDPDAHGGKRDVEFDSLAKGYEYGRTAVHISESEWNITKIETTKSFTIIGFIPADRYEPFLNMGETCMTMARKFDEKSQLALSSLIHALYELSSYAVARMVLKDTKDPVVLLLAPAIEPDFECLYDVPLPFAEDLRSYQFPPLDRVVTVGGQTLTKHRLLPGDELNDAMSDYVDAMDLDKFGRDEEGQPAEYLAPEDSFNPTIHRINQAIRTRAVDAQSAIPPISSTLLRFSGPPSALQERSAREAEYLTSAAQVKKVPPKAKSKRAREPVKPLSGLDVDALLSGGDGSGSGGHEKNGDAPKISRDNAIPQFKRALATSSDEAHIEQAARQMGDVVKGLITDSFGDSLYSRALETLGVMRAELIDYEEPAPYNEFMQDLKSRMLSGELGGDRREMWWRIRTGRLGLIDKEQSEASDVTSEDAQEFLKAK